MSEQPHLATMPTAKYRSERFKMSEYQIQLADIVSWFHSKQQILKDLGITLADIRESHTAKSAAAANFDTAHSIGQIVAWVSGEVDFEVLRVADGKDVFLLHQKVPHLGSPTLETAFENFLQHMTHPDGDDDLHASYEK
jgi:hypothetical protein